MKKFELLSATLRKYDLALRLIYICAAAMHFVNGLFFVAQHIWLSMLMFGIAILYVVLAKYFT